MRILFTGASSFTGTWMAGELARCGHAVTAVYTQSGQSAYEGLRAQRVGRLLPHISPTWGTQFGDDPFLQLCREQGPWDVLCHHAADVRDYKSPQFDWQRALANNTRRLSEVLAAFRAGGGKAVVLTGSYFEADEGTGSPPLRAFSAYGLSKTLTSQAFRFECDRFGLTLGKYVVPNPVGPLEEPRFVSYLADCWKRGAPAVVQTPDYIRDHLPVYRLATDYAAFVVRTAGLPAGAFLRRNPSGWVETVGAFALRVSQHFAPFFEKPCALECRASSTSPASEPLARQNTDACLPGWSAPAENVFWSDWAKSYFTAK